MPTPSWIAWKKILFSCNHITSSSSSLVYDPCLITAPPPPPPLYPHAKIVQHGSDGSHSCCKSLECVVHGSTRVAHRDEQEEMNDDDDDMEEQDDGGGGGGQEEEEAIHEEKESLISPRHRHHCRHRKLFQVQCPPPLHSVTELRVGDSARSVVEIIFQSSWYEPSNITTTTNNNKDNHNIGMGPSVPPGVKPESIFKVHNHPTVVARFEEYRAMVKSKALLQSHHHHHHRKTSSSKKNSRCLVDGNELLRFYCTTITCNMGKTSCASYVTLSSTSPTSSLSSSSSLCTHMSSTSSSSTSPSCPHMSSTSSPSPSPSPPSSSSSSCICMSPSCGVCHILRHGFPARGHPGIHTSASSRRAHEAAVSHTSGGTRHELKEGRTKEQGKLGGTRLAMIVCRVIAGRVKKMGLVEDEEDEDSHETEKNMVSYDSITGNQSDSNLEELLVFNARAVLPCFMVIYSPTLC